MNQALTFFNTFLMLTKEVLIKAGLMDLHQNKRFLSAYGFFY